MFDENYIKAIEKLRKRFNGKTIIIKPRKCNDVPKFLRKKRQIEKLCATLPEMKFK